MRRYEYTPADLTALGPATSAEMVPLHLLEADQPRRGMPLATSLIEQAFHGQPEMLSDAQAAFEPLLNTSNPQRYRAMIFNAYLPIFFARSEQRFQTKDELVDTFGNLHTNLGEYLDFLRNPQGQAERLFGNQIANHAISNTRNFVASLAGESVALYLSLYSTLMNGDKLLFPSSFREDNPTNPQVAKLYKYDVHDAHTYDPFDPTNRVRLSIKTNILPATRTGETAERFNVLQAAGRISCAMADTSISGQHPRLSINDILELLIESEQPDSVYAGTFRDTFADDLHRTIIGRSLVQCAHTAAAAQRTTRQ